SRITYSMARFDLLPRWFARVHPKFRTPVRTLIVFSGIALLELWLAGLSPNAYDLLGNMYAFGAATAYMLVFVSLLVLRFVDPWTPRPFKVPLNIKLRGKDGEVRRLPIVGVLGFLGISTILFLVVLTHSIGRIAGPAWIILGLLIYFWYRRHRKLPVRKALRRNWEKEQLLVYEDAGEHDMADEYRENLARKRRLHHEEERESRLPVGTQVLDVPIHAHSNGEHRRKHKGDME
ncbi:MAG TPA: APC family permease, partial [Ktedonobacteraceae bacterium]|nr:APC family permease [Ktedonobacteraceae bacterium]